MTYAENATSSSYEKMSANLMRLALVVIFLVFGTVKFTDPGWMGIAPFVSNSPFVSWLNMFGPEGAGKIIGASEILVALLLVFGFWRPESRPAIAGAIGCTVTFVVTISFMATTADVFGKGGMPIFATPMSQFLLKDLVLLTASLALLAQGLAHRHRLVAEAPHA